MRILIFGASGRTGQELVKQALAKGHLVTAYVRTPSKMQIKHDHLSMVQGDATDYAAVENAVKGQEAVFSTLGAASPFRFDPTVVEGVQNIIKAMENNGVSRFIYMSAINVDGSRRHAGLLVKLLGTTLLRTETAGHNAREKLIRQSNLSWTLVRPATLSNGRHTGNYRSGEGIKGHPVAVSISRADVADFLLRQLTDSSYIKGTPMVMY